MSIVTLSHQHFPKELSVSLPGSKSISQRALILAALHEGTTKLLRPATGYDTLDLVRCLRELGMEIDSQADVLTVGGNGGRFRPNQGNLSVGSGGTTLRFLLPLLCFSPGIDITITAEARLSERPIAEMITALQSCGADIEYVSAPGHLPLRILGVKLSPGKLMEVDASRSSQFLSGLLLASKAFGFRVKPSGPIASQSYVTLTEKIVEAFPCSEFRIESDWSSATFFLVLACLLQESIELTSLSLDSPQPDRAFLDLLLARGGQASSAGDVVTFIPPLLNNLSADFSEMPDAAIPAAVLAATLPGESCLSGLGTLRHKESDRMAALQAELEKMGAAVKISGDTLCIKGRNLRPARIKTYSDHRIAMAFGVLGAVVDGLEIEEPEVVSKSFPEFWSTLKTTLATGLKDSTP